MSRSNDNVIDGVNTNDNSNPINIPTNASDRERARHIATWSRQQIGVIQKRHEEKNLICAEFRAELDDLKQTITEVKSDNAADDIGLDIAEFLAEIGSSMMEYICEALDKDEKLLEDRFKKLEKAAREAASM